MSSATKMEQISEILSTMSANELAQVMGKASNLRTTRPCLFLELPPELRNTIYRLTIDPQVIETHIRHRKSPPLLRVNRQISEVFHSLYYSTENVSADMYHGPKLGWKAVTNALALQTILVGLHGCFLNIAIYALESIDELRQQAEYRYEEGSESEFSSVHYGEFLDGVFRFRGLPPRVRISCMYNTNAVKDMKEHREERRKKEAAERWSVE